jgi:hypothetical protein
MPTPTKPIKHNGKTWFVAGEYNSRADAQYRRDELKDEFASGRIKPKGILEIIINPKNSKEWILLVRVDKP